SVEPEGFLRTALLDERAVFRLQLLHRYRNVANRAGQGKLHRTIGGRVGRAKIAR
ncbi:MAG: hypothetical protein RL385_5825, partial [Pseudomonadota bacterium]